MTSHEKRVMALMRLHGLSRPSAERRAKAIESGAKKNPAASRKASITGAKGVTRQAPVKRKTAARTQKTAESYVRRPSQITKKAPTKRLKKRRTVNLQSPRGLFPNPKARTGYERKVELELGKHIAVEMSDNKKAWTVFALFPATPDGSKNAIEYAKAYAQKEPKVFIRVVEK